MDARREGDFAVRLRCGGLLCIRWHRLWGQPTGNANGTTGWATVIGYEGQQPAPAVTGAVTRLHVCTHRPCRAVHPASKYGSFPPPIHGHLALGHASVHEAAASAAPEGLGTSGMVALPTDLPPAPHHGPMGSCRVHRVPLACLQAARPLAPPVVAGAPPPPGGRRRPPPCHSGDIGAAMTAHARDFLRPRTYVGQLFLCCSAFPEVCACTCGKVPLASTLCRCTPLGLQSIGPKRRHWRQM